MLCSDLFALCLLGVLVVCDVGDCSLLIDWLCDVCLTSLYGSNYGWCLRLLLSWCLLLLFGLIATFWIVCLVFCWYCVVGFCGGGFVV